MESLSSGELIEILLGLSEDAQNQFQYWLTITFALIVAVTIGKKYLDSVLSISISVLYLATTSLFAFRYYETMRNIGIFLVEFESRGLELYASLSFLFYLRIAVFVLGTSITIWFLYKSAKSSANDT